MRTHNGKIGRLPFAIREQLNQRLQDGETAASLLPWLNALPAVKTLLAARFDGGPVNEQNLSNWRNGGYEHWQKQQERRAIVRDLAEEDDELEAGSIERETVLNQRLSRVLTADFAVAAREVLVGLSDPAERCQRLQEFLQTLKFQRREDYLTGRLKIEMERRARERLAEQDQDEVIQENAPWVRQMQAGEIDNLFASLDFTSQAAGVAEAENLLRSMKTATPPARPPEAG
jgi:hypothetical protein